MSKLGKFFVWYSLVLFGLLLAYFAMNFLDALMMDPSSYNCTSDAMMRQFCEDPFFTSLAWTLLAANLFGLPFFAAWVAIGIMLIAKNESAKSRNKR